MIYNALGANPQTKTVAVPFQVLALILGDFIWDRDGRTEIFVLAHDGGIRIPAAWNARHASSYGFGYSAAAALRC